MRAPKTPLAFAAAALALTLTGCGVSIPSDPSGTLDRVTHASLRAGISPHGAFVDVSGDTPTGSEVEAIEAFAESLDARVEWTIGSEEVLVRGLEEQEIDLVAGGISDDTPWIDKAGVTRPYTEVVDDDGTVRKLVMLVPSGENAFLSELEVFLTDYAEQPR